MAQIPQVGRIQDFVDPNNRPTQRVAASLQETTEGAQTLEGEGSPEGAVVGNVGWKYMDTLTNVFYRKTTNLDKSGWIVDLAPFVTASETPTGNLDGVLGQMYYDDSVGVKILYINIDIDTWEAVSTP